MIKKSKYSFEDTVNKLIEKIRALNAEVFFIVDHKANAEKVRLVMNPAKVIYFGNPRVGTLLMQEKIEICYDLPLRIAIFEKDNSCYLEYKMPSEIAEKLRY